MPHSLLLPPLTLFVPAGLGLWMMRGERKRLGRWIFACASLTLVGLCTPVVGLLLTRMVEVDAVVDLDDIPVGPRAIVILGAGMESSSPEYGRGSLSDLSLERIRYGAYLARATGLPLLTTGSVLRTGTAPVGVEMARVLGEEFRVPVRWVDDQATNTRANARRANEILSSEGIQEVFVVTHAWHMRRALYSFEQTDLRATPAPTMVHPPFALQLGQFVPSSKGLRTSAFALHEMLGLLAYRLGLK
ncbi:MAG: uncharacterized SAM-binding protein YcdF (DUF218 family) [Planctomycetota bacterium]|jgi:uncharacterized SAM-binding protein YcdF (DUF218 family)